MYIIYKYNNLINNRVSFDIVMYNGRKKKTIFCLDFTVNYNYI